MTIEELLGQCTAILEGVDALPEGLTDDDLQALVSRLSSSVSAQMGDLAEPIIDLLTELIPTVIGTAVVAGYLLAETDPTNPVGASRRISKEGTIVNIYIT